MVEKIDMDIDLGLLSKQVGRAVMDWSKNHDVSCDLSVQVLKSKPSCYIDDSGVTHYGDLVTVDIDIADDDSDDSD